VRIVTPRVDVHSPGIEHVDGVIIERFPLINLAQRLPLSGVAVPNIPYIIWQVSRAVGRRLDGVDVLHCHLGSLQTAAAALAGRRAGVAVICKAATAGDSSDLGDIRRTGSSGRLVAWLLQKSVETWVATTAAVESALIRAGVNRINIVRIPNGVELEKKARTVHVRRPVASFLYLGRLSNQAERDIPTLIDAFDRVAKDYSTAELAIVGGGELLDETRELAASCAARDRIQVPGWDEPEKWLSWADCFVLPSRREGLSNALLEAMAAGLPCIANDIPPNREVLDDGNAGVLVPVGNCSALASAMRRMIDDHESASLMSCAAAERVRRCYSIAAVASRYARLYDSVARDAPAASLQKSAS